MIKIDRTLLNRHDIEPKSGDRGPSTSSGLQQLPVSRAASVMT